MKSYRMEKDMALKIRGARNGSQYQACNASQRQSTCKKMVSQETWKQIEYRTLPENKIRSINMMH